MLATNLPGVVRRSVWATRVAQSRRHGAVDTSRPTTIAVASIDNRMLSTPVAALVALVLEESSVLPVAALDGDGVAQPMRGPLGAGDRGDIFGLATAPASSMSRANIERYADITGMVPLVSAGIAQREPVPPEVVEAVVTRVAHRWPTIVINLPYTCPPETIATATALADRVLLVADRHHTEHSWLYEPGHHLTEKARAGRVTVVTVGAMGEELPSDTVAPPNVSADTTSRSRMLSSTAPEDLSMYQRLLVRLFA